MKLSRDEVTRIATLARLRLTGEEIERYRTQLSDILAYIDQLQEVDTSRVEPTAQVTGQTNVLADDVVGNQPQTDRLLAGAPLRGDDGNSIKVKAVFDDAGSSA